MILLALAMLPFLKGESMVDPNYVEPDGDPVTSFRVDHLVHLSKDNDPANLNVSFLPLPGEIMIENNITVSVEEEDITTAIVQKVRDLLAAAQADDTVQGIIENLPEQEVMVKVRTTEKPKSGEDLFKELISNMESNLRKTQENEGFLNYAYTDGDYDTGNVDYTEYYTEEENNEEYYEYDEKLPNGIDATDLLRGDSDEISYNIDLTYNEDPTSSEKFTTTEAPKHAFPELLRDLMIFNEIDDQPIKEKAQTKKNNIRISSKYLNFLNKKKNYSADLPLKNSRKDSVAEKKADKNTLDHSSRIEKNAGKDTHNALLVQTTAGSVHGQEIVISTGATVREYLGIPYAKPPTGQLRFKPPLPPQQSNTVRKATTEQPRCWNSFAKNSWEVCCFIIRDILIQIFKGQYNQYV